MVDETERPLKERLQSRKFILANLLQVGWIGLFLYGSLSEAGMITLTQLTIGGYFIGNVGEHFSKK